ncbi:HK97 family phage prohead protease [Albibacillus kandeliae]|uniref:HK97 family phage prohead protease n=1 Tax=Albibacillus kandeliae TaxID=2174228 RepID=UPI000D69C587|nr:HK97 family phage prohead protease [Albibacillus kandeliae]
METRTIWAASDLEVRQQGGLPAIVGKFPYLALAVLADRGTVRKETIAPGAFEFSLSDATREINLLFGHSFDKPLASKKSKTLELADSETALEFRAVIPAGAEKVSHVADALALVGAGLVKGVSPGFRVPPKDVVPNAEELVPEEGNPGVMIRRLNHLVLYELSLVTRPAYEESAAELRDMIRANNCTGEHRVLLP